MRGAVTLGDIAIATGLALRVALMSGWVMWTSIGTSDRSRRVCERSRARGRSQTAPTRARCHLSPIARARVLLNGGICRWAADGRSRRGAAIPDRDGSRVASANSAHGMVPKVCVLRTLSVYRCVRIPRNLRRHFAADGRTASAADHVNSVRRSICHAFRKNPRQRCVSMTENSALFGSRPGGENLRIASATHDDNSVLQKGRHRWQSQPH